MAQNPMREIRIEKVTLNIGVGEGGRRVRKAANLLETLTDQDITLCHTAKRTNFGTPADRPIGAKVTLRGDDAEAFVRNALKAKDNTLPARSFDEQGNVAFGISEHIDLPGIKYDPDIGIFGMDICITIERPGYRVKRRRISNKIGDDHQVKPEEAQEFMKDLFGVEIVE